MPAGRATARRRGCAASSSSRSSSREWTSRQQPARAGVHAPPRRQGARRTYARSRLSTSAPDDPGLETVIATRRAASEPATENLARRDASVLAQLETREESTHPRQSSGHDIKVTNLDKELWPATRISAALHEARPARLPREGAPVAAAAPARPPAHADALPQRHRRRRSFYQKHYEDAARLRRHGRVYSRHERPRSDVHRSATTCATLLWLGQIADLALHTSLARINPEPDAPAPARPTFTGSRRPIEASVLNYPDFILFDLDPYIYAGTRAKARSRSSTATPG